MLSNMWTISLAALGVGWGVSKDRLCPTTFFQGCREMEINLNILRVCLHDVLICTSRGVNYNTHQHVAHSLACADTADTH